MTLFPVVSCSYGRGRGREEERAEKNMMGGTSQEERDKGRIWNRGEDNKTKRKGKEERERLKDENETKITCMKYRKHSKIKIENSEEEREVNAAKGGWKVEDKNE